LLTLSEQQLVDCAGGFNTMGCSGGSPAAAFSYIIQDGICLNSDYPYTARNATCRSCPSVLKFSRAIRIPIGDEQTLAARVTKEPVSVVLNGNWFNEYREGVADPGCKGAKAPEFAAALIVGFGQTNSADPAAAYWLVKNSVGTGWGEKGYFRIVRGQNKCGIADFALSHSKRRCLIAIYESVRRRMIKDAARSALCRTGRSRVLTARGESGRG
jgi:C1A family cysteine protease